MLYIRNPLQVDAIKLIQPMTINNRAGQPGDYLVTYPDGSAGIMKGEVFEANFMPHVSLAVPAPTIQTPPPPQM